MIDEIITTRLFQASQQLLREAGFSLEDCAEITISDFDVAQPDIVTPCDLSTSGAIRLAVLLRQNGQQIDDRPRPTTAEVARSLCIRSLEMASNNDFAARVKQCIPTINGYINFELTDTGIREWLLAVISGALLVEQKQHKFIVNSLMQTSETVKINESRMRTLRSCTKHAQKWINEARDNRFDVEEKRLLPPLIDQSAIEFLHSFKNDLALSRQTFPTEDQVEALQLHRNLIVSAGILVGDLVPGQSSPPSAFELPTLRLKQASKHAQNLAKAWTSFFENNALIGPSDYATRTSLVLLASTSFLIDFTVTLIQTAATDRHIV